MRRRSRDLENGGIISCNVIALFLEEHKNELKSIMNDIDIIHSLIIPSFKLISYSSLKSARK